MCFLLNLKLFGREKQLRTDEATTFYNCREERWPTWFKFHFLAIFLTVNIMTRPSKNWSVIITADLSWPTHLYYLITDVTMWNIFPLENSGNGKSVMLKYRLNHQCDHNQTKVKSMISSHFYVILILCDWDFCLYVLLLGNRVRSAC